MKFRTTSGMTEFTRKYISAYTEHDEGTDVFMVCGTVFTVARIEREMFSNWMKGESV
tara:strand:- start:1246 stop:1416 length:171 start_codon:yes stop_codon:yes gene_type:complete